MQVELRTSTLSTIMGRVSKGLVTNKFLEYTGYVMITVYNKHMEFTVNDGSNVYVHKINVGHKKEDSQYDAKACINGENFLKLVNKITTEKTKLTFKKDTVVVKGNGTYTFKKEIGDVPYKTYSEIVGDKEISEHVLPPISKFNLAEAGLSKLIVNPTLMGYYFTGNKLITTNGVKLSIVETEESTDTNYYLTTRMYDLLKTCDTEEEVRITQAGDINILKTPTKFIYGPVQPGQKDFPAESANSIASMEFNHSITVESKRMLEIINRLLIFTEVNLKFTFKDGVVEGYASEKENTKEIVTRSADKDASFSAVYNVNELKDLLEKHSGKVTLHFNDGSSPIKLTSEGIEQILAAVTEEE